MASKLLSRFEQISRKAGKLSYNFSEETAPAHPFDERNIHPEIAQVSQRLFDDGHYSQASYEAIKLIEKKVSKLSELKKYGFNLMIDAFAEERPKIKLTNLVTLSERDIQNGWKYIFAGAMLAIRNPLAHDIVTQPIDSCLDYLSFASMLLRQLELRRQIH